MIVKAILKNVRISGRKVKPVLDKIRGLLIEKAINILTFSNKKSAFIVKKLLRSVIANAEHNNNLNIDKLIIYRIYVCQGPSLKRARMRAKGRSNRIIKRSCHIFVNVKEEQ